MARGKTRDVFGCMADDTEVADDIERPLWTEEGWKAFLDESAAQLLSPAAPRPKGPAPRGTNQLLDARSARRRRRR